MIFNDTTNHNGLIQRFERWTRQTRGTVSGDTDLLKEATVEFNEAFNAVIPLLLFSNDQIKWDDANNTDKPVGTINLTANQNAYKITVDDNSYKILNLTKVQFLPSATATQYVDLPRLTSDNPRSGEIISPNTSITGVPSGFMEIGPILYLDCGGGVPSYSATNGIKLFFGRAQQQFVYTDTTKEPGIPQPFHELLVLHAAKKWNAIYRTDDTNLLAIINAEIAREEAGLKRMIGLSTPSRQQMTFAHPNHL